jgi:hypothetical protein
MRQDPGSVSTTGRREEAAAAEARQDVIAREAALREKLAERMAQRGETPLMPPAGGEGSPTGPMMWAEEEEHRGGDDEEEDEEDAMGSEPAADSTPPEPEPEAEAEPVGDEQAGEQQEQATNLRRQYGALKLSELRRLALQRPDRTITEDELENLLDEPDPKASIIQLLVAAEMEAALAAAAAAAAAAAHGNTPRELSETAEEEDDDDEEPQQLLSEGPTPVPVALHRTSAAADAEVDDAPQQQGRGEDTPDTPSPAMSVLPSPSLAASTMRQDPGSVSTTDSREPREEGGGGEEDATGSEPAADSTTEPSAFGVP